jgi:beta-lactamase regulating signal transducer with metallopeptidase domain
MSATGTALGWLLHTLVGGGLLLLVARLLMAAVRSPARRQRLGEWAMVSALLLPLLALGPAWLLVPLPARPAAEAAPAEPTPQPAAPPAEAAPLPEDVIIAEVPPGVFELPPAEAPPAAEVPPAPAAPGRAAPEAPARRLPSAAALAWLVIAAYGCAAALLLGRWLLGHLALWRLLRTARPAPPRVGRLFGEVGAGRPRLLVSPRVRVPFSCGLLRPAVVLPAALAEAAPEPVLRWVLAHEGTHLARRDACAGLLFGIGQGLYFALPWFWSLRRQVRLCQEYIADAAAAGAAGRPEDYAQFLLNWTAAPAVPAGATGVSGRCSDLFRRVTMLLQNPAPVEPRCPRRWSLTAAGGLLACAVLAAGVGLRAAAAPVPAPKDEPKKEEKKQDKKDDKKDAPAKAEPRFFDDFPPPVVIPPDAEEMIKRLQRDFGPEHARRMQEQMERNRKLMQEAMERSRKQREQMLEMMRRNQNAFAAPVFPGQARRAPHDARLGVQVTSPSPALVDQLDLPKGQGLVVEEVLPESAAAKAGIKPHDVLLEINGKAVPDKGEELAKLLEGIAAKKSVEAVVLRKGKKETVKGLTLPEPRAAADVQENNFAFPVPVVPRIDVQVPAFNGLNANAFAVPGGAGNVMTTTFRSRDRFTTRHQEGSLVITVTGKVADGKSQVTEIRVQDGRESHRYESVDKVPAEYRDKVKSLVESTNRTNARIDVQAP